MKQTRLFVFISLLVLLFCSSVFAQNFSTNQKPITSEESEAANAKYISKLDSYHIMDAFANKTNASKEDMDLFSNFYADTLSNDQNDFSNKIGKTIKSDFDIQLYAKGKINNYIQLYKNLQKIKQEYPSTANEYSAHNPGAITLETCPNTNDCSTIGFESGNLSGWQAYYASNNSTTTTMTYTGAVGGLAGAVTEAALDPVTNGYKNNSTYQVKIMSGVGVDPIDPAIPIVAPGGGNYSCRVGDTSEGGSRVAIIQQSFTVPASITALTYMYAIIIDSAHHTFGQQPHLIITISDLTRGDTLPCGQYVVYAPVSGSGGYTTIHYRIPSYGWDDPILCKPWTNVFVPLRGRQGDCISVQVLVSDCFPGSPGPHFCYAYFDAVCGKDTLTSTPATCGSNGTLSAPLATAYQWTGPNIVGSTTSQTISVGATGTYTVVIKNEDGCTDTLQQFVTIIPPLNASVTPTNQTCTTKGSADVTLSGGTSPFTYEWSNGNTTTNDTALTVGNYYLLVADSKGCKDSVPFTISSVTLTVKDTSINASCATKGSATVNPISGTAPYTYHWSNGKTTASDTGLSAGNYYVLITDNKGCKDSLHFTIITSSALSAKDTTINAGCTTKGSAAITFVNGTAPYTYHWSNGATSANDTGLSAGNYYVLVTDKKGCKDSLHFALTAPIIPTVNIPPPPEVCYGDSVQLNANGSAGVTYHWSNGATTSSIWVKDTAKTSYTVTVSNGCNAQATTVLTPDAAAYIDACCGKAIIKGDDTILVATGGSKFYKWQDSSKVICLDPPLCDTVKVMPEVTTTYTVTGTDSLGCQTETLVTITVETPCANFIVPNVFTPSTPGPEGLNDKFYIQTQGLNSWSIIIYDRWGKVMFQTTNPDQYWNGNINNGTGQAPSGVYYYIIKATCQENTYKKDGFLQLIR